MASFSSFPPITTTETEQVEKLKELLQDIQLNPERFGDGKEVYLRYLRARKHNINNAAEGIRNYMKHREKYELDTVENWEPCEEARQYLHYEFTGYDDDGCPVYYIPWGSWNFKKLIELECVPDASKRYPQVGELAERRMRSQALKLGQPVPGFVFIVDLDKFSLKNLVSKAALEIVIGFAIVADSIHAPSTKFWAITNVPKAFSYIWKIVTPFMSKETRSKVQFNCRCTDNELKDYFSERNIPDACVPTILGGDFVLSFTL